jgi:hypothetical protein
MISSIRLVKHSESIGNPIGDQLQLFNPVTYKDTLLVYFNALPIAKLVQI